MGTLPKSRQCFEIASSFPKRYAFGALAGESSKATFGTAPHLPLSRERAFYRGPVLMDEPPALTRARKYLEAVDADMHTAIFCVEVLRPILFDKNYLTRFERTFAAHVVTYLQHALHRDGLMCMCRIWDTASDARSIPNVASCLHDRRTVEAIKLKRRRSREVIVDEWPLLGGQAEEMAAIRASAERDADQAEMRVDAAIDTVMLMMEDEKLDALRRNSKIWRDRNVAHSLEFSRDEGKFAKAGVEVLPLKWGELEKLLGMTEPIVRDLWVLVADTSTFAEDLHRAWGQYADAFWSAVQTPA